MYLKDLGGGGISNFFWVGRPSAAPLSFTPSLASRGGGVAHRWICSGGGGEDDQYLSKTCLKIFFGAPRRQFCNFLQDFRLPLGKSCPPPEGGRKFFRWGQKKSRALRLSIFNFRPPLGKILCTRLIRVLLDPILFLPFTGLDPDEIIEIMLDPDRKKTIGYSGNKY